MSFIILILIIILLYATLTKYSSIYKVMFMALLVAGMTSLFLIYGITVFKSNDSFVILNTSMNKITFIHACIIWYAVDIIVFWKILKNHRKYKEVNSI